jgi:hypothetical protein
LEFRKGTTEQFPSVFRKGNKRTASSNYGWFAVIDGLANGDILKFEKITELPLMFALTKLSLDADRNKEKEKEMKKRQNKI